jgi:hypothetical protein
MPGGIIIEFSVVVCNDTRNECHIIVESSYKLMLRISRNILTRIEKCPKNKWHAGNFLHHGTDFEPLPDVDIVKFLHYVSESREECLCEEELARRNDRMYIQDEIDRLTKKLKLL